MRPEELNSKYRYDFYFKSTRSFLDYTSNDPKFRRVKFLKTYLHLDYAQLDDAFDFLSSFEFLEDIHVTVLLRRFALVRSSNDLEKVQEKKLVVNLEHLKRASFDFYPGPFKSKISLTLNLSSLRSIGLISLERVYISHPEKLQVLVVCGLFQGMLDYSLFSSLEYILTDVNDLRSISASFIEKLPSLRKLDLDDPRKLCHQPAKLTSGVKEKVKIFYCGFEINIKVINLEDE